jgi:peptidoglycan/xylan/chitin deacetylase (PgdA/CDA1 family)
VSPTNFAEHLEVLRKAARPATLGEVVKALRDGQALKRSFAVTFDDGYPDTRHVAQPIIECHEIPATVFVISGMLDGAFWWSELKAMIEHCQRLPEEINLQSGNRAFDWHVGADTAEQRTQLLQVLEDFFRPEASSTHGRLLEQLRTIFEKPDNDRSEVRAMTANELMDLAASNLVEVGSHTVTHTPLDQLNVDQQIQELHQSKVTLEEATGRRVRSFSFPNGAVSHATPGVARELGYEAGCCSRIAAVSPDCDPLMLPRVWPGDWDGDQFSRWLRRWL